MFFIAFILAWIFQRGEPDGRPRRAGDQRDIYRDVGTDGLTYVASDARWAEYLDITHNPASAELTVFCGAMVGASLGFLWYNSPPAEVFMGDVGSLAIGGALGTVAILTKQEFLLPFIGGVFILEAFSDDAGFGFQTDETRRTAGPADL